MPILFIICPVITIIGIYFNFYYSKGDQNFDWKYLIYCILIVSLVNSTKVPENDLIWYLEAYERANGISFIAYIPLSGVNIGAPCTDFGYNLYVWILSNLFNGNTAAFKFVNSIVTYLILGFSIIKFGRKFQLPRHVVLVAITLMLFIPYIFTMSLQIVRQFFSGCILIYLLLDLLYFDSIKSFLKKNGLFILLMFAFHKSSLFFIIFFLCPFLRKNPKDSILLYCGIIVALVGYQFLAKILLPFLEDEQSSFSSAVQRASADTTFDLGQMSLIKILLICIFIFISITYAYLIRPYNKIGQLKHILNIILITCIFILLNLHQSELSNRFYFYILPFFPFLYILISLKYSRIKGMSHLIFFVTIFSWMIYLYYGVWDYNLPVLGVFSPIFLYLM